MTENHFATLGLKAGATEDEIKKAYRSLAKTWHPDKNKSPGAEEEFKKIAAAYNYLQKKDRREILEGELKKKRQPPPAADTTKKPASPTYNWEYKGTEKKPSKGANISGEAGPSHSKENGKEGTSKEKSPHWSDSFRNTKNKKPAQGRDWKPWNTSDWAEDFENPTAPSTSGFSAAFSGFRTFLNNIEKELGSFADAASLFTSNFEGDDSFSFKPAQPKFQKQRQPRFVASEHGYNGGLDEEYLFSPRSPKNGELHEDDTLFGDDHGSEEDSFQHNRHQDWRSTHQDVLNKIRRDRKAYQAKLKREASEAHKCVWCGRTFTLRALDRHVLICKERVHSYEPMTERSFGASQDSAKFTMGKEENTTTPKATGHWKRSASYTSNTDVTSDDCSPASSRAPQGDCFHGKSKTAKTSSSKEKLKTPSPSGSKTATRNPGSCDSTQETHRQREDFSSGLMDRLFQATGFKQRTSASNSDFVRAKGCTMCSQKFGENSKFCSSCGLKKSGGS